jgi:hypothetical protein
VATLTQFAAPTTAIPGWTVSGPVLGLPPAGVSIVDGSLTAAGVPLSARSGKQWLNLAGNGYNTDTVIAQTIVTVPGHQYQLSYHVGNYTGPPFGLFTSRVGVFIDGAFLFTDTNATDSPSSINWQPFAHTFTAAGTSTTIAFQNGDVPTDFNNGIDDVVVVDLTPPAPVPTSSGWWLAALAAGLGLLAARRSRRAGA